ncbi:MAG: Hpt domain-containing protein [Zoogloea sp.]|nr:Hpt domain-containing protein [Zoogloea sp.]
MAIETPGFPASIEGLDIVAGLRRLEGDGEFYIALLRDFISTEQDAATVIAAALAAGDRKAATRRAHTVKGLAGTFGAVRLQPAALALELALRNTEPQQAPDAELQAFAAELDALIRELTVKLPPEDAPETQPAGPVDPHLLALTCRELAGLLTDCDVAAGRLLSVRAGLFQAAFPEHAPRLEHALRNFDFDDAAETLAEACRQHGIKLDVQ